MVMTDLSREVLTGTGTLSGPSLRTPASGLQSLFIILINVMFYNDYLYIIPMNLLISATKSTLSQHIKLARPITLGLPVQDCINHINLHKDT